MKDNKIENLESMINMVRFENGNQTNKHGVEDIEIKEWINRIGNSFYELLKSSKKYQEGTVPRDDLAEKAIQIATYALKLAEILSVQGKDQ